MVVGHNQPDSSLFSLPLELIERILLLMAIHGFPEAIATTAQTCRDMRQLIQSRWEDMFWLLFKLEDPRPAIRIDQQDGRPSRLCSNPDWDFVKVDWAAEFKRCLPLYHFINQCKATLPGTVPSHTMELTAGALEGILTAVRLAAPFPGTIFDLGWLQGQHIDDDGPSHPIFPPPLTTYPTFQHSRNLRYIDSVLKQYLPPTLIIRLAGNELPGGRQAVWPTEVESRVMRAFGRITAFWGFRPMVFENSDAVDPRMYAFAEELNGNGKDAGSRSPDGTRELGVQTDAHATPATLEMSIEAQQTRARRLARMRVYNMRYLNPERHWGPFLLPSSAERMFATEALQSAGAQHDAEQPDIIAEASIPGPTEPITSDTLPGPAQLRADWAYLGAVRIVVEANLRDTLDSERLNGLSSLDGLRPGTAPRGLRHAGERMAEQSQSQSKAGKGRALHKDEVEGWDWAGVEGIWRRCVCWMDYRDLILHNLSDGFDDPTLEEAIRIVPMRLRVAYYTPSAIPKYAHRPTIHLEGETAGPAGAIGNRRIHGTVCMIVDGSIRWTLWSSTTQPEGGRAEWVSEGVQIGGVNSVMGILGMWTGGQHERMDPLGPFWAWKVG